LGYYNYDGLSMYFLFMLSTLFKKIVGTRNDRIIKKYKRIVKQINALEADLIPLTDESLQQKTHALKEKYAQGINIDDLLVEAFAVCREASRRVMNMRHFDVQLIGGMALHFGKISEMRTGEGKTLMATLPAYLNALSGNGVHIVTVNDYLAERDAKWMSRLFNFLGLSVGINLSGLTNKLKQDAYQSDITYSTNNELGFDYLRDNMVYAYKDKVQRPLNFAIVDEVDSILIDEARTPLIISGMAEDHTDLYQKINAVPAMLSKQIGEEKADGTGVEVPGDFFIDEKSHQVFLTEQGHEKTEEILEQMGLIQANDSLYAPHNISLMHHIYAALRAHNLYNKDQHYVIQNDEIIIVDEFTGRLMSGRRWSEGLHQAVEAKEGIAIQPENQTMASITFQNYFRMYKKLAGMTGTADTEAYEFQEIYGLETIVIPTNKPIVRKDAQDQIFKNTKAKYLAIVEEIKKCQSRGQPTLVGTTSIENSEYVSELLKKESIAHQVLNAKQHANEAQIIVQAGKKSMVTIATNMAGRGTDIILGGNIEPNVNAIEQDTELSHTQKQQKITALREEWKKDHAYIKSLGGLQIIGTERHESRRIDNQLRGRAGRQGDPGASVFFLCLDDDLMRIFGGERLKSLFERLKMPDNEPIQAGMVSRSIEGAQRKVEGRNFDTRKQLLQYDDVANEQRRELYALRNQILERNQIESLARGLIKDVIVDIVQEYVPAQSLEEQWKLEPLNAILQQEWHLNLNIIDHVNKANIISSEEVLELIQNTVQESYAQKLSLAGAENFHDFEHGVMLSSIDYHWRDHLANLDHLRQGIHLRGYAQKNPTQEYKKEAFELFNILLSDIKHRIVKTILSVQIQQAEENVASLEDAYAQNQMSIVEKAEENEDNNLNNYSASLHNQMGLKLTDLSNQKEVHKESQIEDKIDTQNIYANVGRNDACPCGSGKRYKHCHGMINQNQKSHEESV
jgi:preprotein translocase subunit SecA